MSYANERLIHDADSHLMELDDESLQGVAPAVRQRFFADNFIDLMGRGLAPALQRPARLAAA